MLLFIVGHILAVPGSSFSYGVFPEFEGLSFSLWYFPVYFYPYYFLLALARFYHSTNGLQMLAAKNGLILNANIQKSMPALAARWIAISLAALGGLLFDVGNNVNHDFAQLLETVFGTDPTVPILLIGGLGL
ncbi:MAG: succinate dehydrogenase/fumarate reductase cytochrome b subunit [Candidatus Azotimanducaceae bacterium]